MWVGVKPDSESLEEAKTAPHYLWAPLEYARPQSERD
jgi:hypothetical protein